MDSRDHQSSVDQNREPPFTDQRFLAILATVATVFAFAGAFLAGHSSGIGLVLGFLLIGWGGSGVIAAGIGAIGIWRRHRAKSQAARH